MATASAAKLDDLKDQLREKGRMVAARDAVLERAKSLYEDALAQKTKAEEKLAKVKESIEDITSTERVLISAIGGGIAGGLTSIGINAGVNFLSKYSTWVEKQKGYVSGVTQIVIGAGAGTASLLLRGDKPGLPSDIAFAGSATLTTFGVGKCAKTWWDRRAAAQELVKKLLDERAAMQAQAAANAAAAAQAQQQRRPG